MFAKDTTRQTMEDARVRIATSLRRDEVQLNFNPPLNLSNGLINKSVM